MDMKMQISHRTISSEHPCFVIAEVAQAHDGSLGFAHAHIDAIAKTGADAVKFQTHIAEAESTASEPWRVKFSLQDDRRFDYWKRMEFTETQWEGLKRHAEEKGLIFISSPFSVEAVELLRRIGVTAWKIASGEVSNVPMFERIADSGLPVILSTGMSRIAEIDAAMERIRARRLPVALLQCSSMYPTPPEKVGLNLMSDFRKRYGCAVGLSDHSGTIFPGLAGAALGMELLEVHITMSREMFGPDVPASVTNHELMQLINGIRFIEKMRKTPTDKNEMADDLEEMRSLFTKSIVAGSDLKAGIRLTEHHLAIKKPGTGIPAERLSWIVGKQLTRNLKKDELILASDVM